MKTRIPESIILAIAIVVFGVLVYFGIDKASDRGRVVHVRGLAENGSSCRQGFLEHQLRPSRKRHEGTV